MIIGGRLLSPLSYGINTIRITVLVGGALSTMARSLDRRIVAPNLESTL
jgi:hypothetical protein